MLGLRSCFDAELRRLTPMAVCCRIFVGFGDGTSSTIVEPTRPMSRPRNLPGDADGCATISGCALGIDSDRIAGLVREARIADAGVDMSCAPTRMLRFDWQWLDRADGAVNAFNWTSGTVFLKRVGRRRRGTRFEEPETLCSSPLTITAMRKASCSPIDSDQMTIVVEAAPVLAVIADDNHGTGSERACRTALKGPRCGRGFRGRNPRMDLSRDGTSFEGASVRPTPLPSRVSISCRLPQTCDGARLGRQL